MHPKYANYQQASEIFYKLCQKYRPKDKRLFAALQQFDPGFAEIIQQSLVITWNDQHGLLPLRACVDVLLSGRRSEEWILSGPLGLR